LRELCGVRRGPSRAGAESVAERRARPKRPAILSRSLRLADRRAEVPRHVRAPVEGAWPTTDGADAWLARAASSHASGGANRSRRAYGRASLDRERQAHAAGGLSPPAGSERTTRPPGDARAADGHILMAARQTIRIHQVLATLGYGDAIGHEVLGIQRVLRGAGYESDIFVEAADLRLDPLTRDYRELVDHSRPDNLILHHFSLGSKASRTAFALPDRMALIYHNITPPDYFIGIHRKLARQCFGGRRELRAYADRCDLALGDSEFNRQDLEALGFL